MYRDQEFDPETPEQQAQREQEELIARRVRQEVLRIRRGEAEEDLREAEQQEAEVREEQEQKAAKERRRKASTFWQLLSGTILVREGMSKYYPYMILLAVLFLLNIMVMFWSLHLDMRYSGLEGEVQKLRERSIRLQEQRYRRTTHSAISAELQRRGIELYDPQLPGEIIEN